MEINPSPNDTQMEIVNPDMDDINLMYHSCSPNTWKDDVAQWLSKTCDPNFCYTIASVTIRNGKITDMQYTVTKVPFTDILFYGRNQLTYTTLIQFKNLVTDKITDTVITDLCNKITVILETDILNSLLQNIERLDPKHKGWFQKTLSDNREVLQIAPETPLNMGEVCGALNLEIYHPVHDFEEMSNDEYREAVKFGNGVYTDSPVFYRDAMKQVKDFSFLALLHVPREMYMDAMGTTSPVPVLGARHLESTMSFMASNND